MGMRLTQAQIENILKVTQETLGHDARVTLFGSRARDDAKGGDVDLMVEVNRSILDPALVSARISSRVSRAMHGRRVDVLLKAPNLMTHPIHDVATQTGIVLCN